MKLWPEALAGRLFLALALAACAIAALAQLVSERDAVAAAVARPKAAPQPRPVRQIVPVPAVAGRILLSSSPQIVPAEPAPVVQLLADGTEVLRRAPPLPEGPQAAALLPGEAVIVLPAATLGQLTPEARGALVELIGRLVRERPVPATRFATLDFRMPVADLERLLAWVY
ncbi:MAG: hypothetical protein KDC48_20040 [Planctomycetes bacterium]|nr:hypothetical protein [Planctomycetota bacterium]